MITVMDSDPAEDSPEKASPAAELLPLDEDSALALLSSADVTAETLAQLARSSIAAKSRKVTFALVQHARTPRHVSIPVLRRMFTFDLLQVTLTPVISADIKRVAEEQILVRSASLPAGQKTTLARRASGRVAAQFLLDPDQRIIAPALNNARLTEALVVQALMKPAATELLFALVGQNAKWSQRREVQIALLRSEKTPLEIARPIALRFSPEFLRSIVPMSRQTMLIHPPSRGDIKRDDIK
jgi:hypothetical protein